MKPIERRTCNRPKEGLVSTGQVTPRSELQSGMVGMATRLRKEQRIGSRGENPQSSKGLALERSKPIKNRKSEDSSRHKRLRMSDRMYR